MTQDFQAKKMNQLIGKCWADEGFKRKLVADPAATLKAEGAELPAGLSIKVLENTDKVFYLVIPAKPSDLSDDQLDKVAGGIIVDWLPPAVSGTGGAPTFTRADGSVEFGLHFKYDIKGNKEG